MDIGDLTNSTDRGNTSRISSIGEDYISQWSVMIFLSVNISLKSMFHCIGMSSNFISNFIIFCGIDLITFVFIWLRFGAHCYSPPVPYTLSALPPEVARENLQQSKGSGEVGGERAQWEQSGGKRGGDTPT